MLLFIYCIIEKDMNGNFPDFILLCPKKKWAVTKWRIEWVTGKTFLSVPFCYAHPTLVLDIIRQAHAKFALECANVFRHRLCQHLQFRRSPIWFSSHCHWCFHFKSNILADDGDILVLRMCIENETKLLWTSFALKSNPTCKKIFSRRIYLTIKICRKIIFVKRT